MMDFLSIVGVILAIFCSGVAVGKIVEKIERLDRIIEDERKHTKNDRH